MPAARALLIIISLYALGCASAGPRRLCEHVTLEEGRLDLNRNARLLVCGNGNPGTEGWAEVPLPQARYQIAVLLQNQGYLHPRFERNGEQLRVWSGPLERIERLEVTGADDLLAPGRKRQIVGQPLTPEKLDEVKRWAEAELRAKGYACPRVDVRAQAWDHRVIIDVAPNGRRFVGGFSFDGLAGLEPRTIARYQATEPGARYDVRETQLTTSRLMADGLFQSAFIKETCRGVDQVDLDLRTAVGRPRILRFGVGASTEEFPFARIWFKHARLDDRASSFNATLYGSPRTQSLDLGAELYRLPFSRRMFIGPRALIQRVKEVSGEVNSAQFGVDLGRYWDAWGTRMQARVGPTLNYVDTVVGVGPQHLGFVSWTGRYSVMTHPYELFIRDQREGWTGDFNYRGQRVGVGSPINVDRYEVNFKYLWNLTRQTPPVLVLGTRLQGVAVNANAPDFDESTRTLPIDYRVFYGGDQTLRGFSRQSLNNDELGYLTALYLGLEMRLVEELPYHLEPFLLFDAARLGERRLSLDPSLFTSSGFGLRWGSPFGTLRGSLARGAIIDADPRAAQYRQDWVGFLSFGQEF